MAWTVQRLGRSISAPSLALSSSSSLRCLRVLCALCGSKLTCLSAQERAGDYAQFHGSRRDGRQDGEGSLNRKVRKDAKEETQRRGMEMTNDEVPPAIATHLSVVTR